MGAQGEFRISVSARNADPDVAALGDGGYLVTWTDATGDPSTRSRVSTQRYLADGTPIGTAAPVNPGGLGAQDTPKVAALAGGGYAIAWGGAETPRGGRLGLGQFAADGAPLDAQSLQLPAPLWQHGGQAVLGLNDGSFVLAWHSAQGLYDFDVYSRRYAANGQPLGGVSRVNTTTEGAQQFPAVARAGSGYVVAWGSHAPGGSGVYAQRYAVDATPLGAEIRVDTAAVGAQSWPAATTLANGDCVVIWVGEGSSGGQTAIYGRRYTAAGGLPAGPQQRLVDAAGPLFSYRAIAALAGGGFVLAWSSRGQDGGWLVQAQRFDALGAPADEPARVNATADGKDPAVAGLRDGGYVIVWASGAGGLSYTTDIYGRRFDAQP